MNSTISPRIERGAKARARVAMMMMTVALGACGGGGGGSSPPPPPPAPAPAPTPSLALKADAASVDAGGPPVGLHAILTASSAAVAWVLTGPGTLSGIEGPDVQYLPPDAESLDTAAKATITMTAGSFAPQSIDIAVGAVDRPGHHWTLVRPPTHSFSDIAQGNGSFVAAGGSSGAARSPDGLTWTDITLYPNPVAIAWGDAGWVAVTSQGTAWFSADSITWTRTADPIPTQTNGVIYGNHTYLAYGYGNSAVSADGTHWTPVVGGATAAAFGNGEFMALRQNPASSYYDMRPATSADGINWQPATNVSNLFGIAFANGHFVANAGTWLWVTDNGATWIGSNGATDYHGGRLRTAGNVLFDLGQVDIGVLLPGASWQRVTTGDFLSTPVAVAANADRFVGVSNNGWIEASADGVHWATQVEGSYGELRAIDFVDGQFVALSTLNHFMRSADGVGWDKATILSGQTVPFLYPMAITHGGHTVVAVGAYSYGPGGYNFGDNSLWVRSLDGGATWAQAATTGPAETMQGVAFDGQRFVSISASGKVYASSDGDAWGQIGTAPAPLSRYLGLAYGGGTYLAFGDGVVATSPDGVTWTAIDANELGRPTSHVRINSAIWAGTRFVLAGVDSDPVTYALQNFSAVSTDGRAWSTKNGYYAGAPVALASCGNEIVSVGNSIVPVSSTDGLNWYPHYSLQGTAQLEAVSCSSDRFVGVGWAGAIVTSTR